MAAPSTPTGPTHATIDIQFFETVFVFSKINNCADLCGRCRNKVMTSLVEVSKRAHAPDMFGISQAAKPGEHIRTVTTLLGGIAIATVDKPDLRPVELGALLRSHSDRSWMPRLVDRWIGWLAPPGSLVGGGWTEAQAKLWLALAGFYDEADIVRSRNIRDFVMAHKDVIERSAISTVPGCECNVRKFAARLGYLAGTPSHRSACHALWVAAHLPAALRDAVGKIPSVDGSLGDAPNATVWFMLRWRTPDVWFAILRERRSAEFHANTKAVGWWSAWVGAPPGYVEPQQARASGVERFAQLKASLSLLQPRETAGTEQEPVLTLE